MKILVFLIFIFLQVNSFFLSRFKPKKQIQIGFLKGSFIKEDFYQPFFDNLQEYSEEKLNITFLSYQPFQKLENNTILIGHSFGGFFSLLYTINEQIKNRNNIEKLILINSHFNARYKMPYFKILPESINVPTLVLLNRKDEKLPLKKALDDYNYVHEKKDDSKQFFINNGNHTSSFTETNEMDIVCNQIMEFIKK